MPARKSSQHNIITPIQEPPARGLRLSEAARYSGATLWFLRTAIWEGRLKSIKLGKRIIILREELDRFLNAQAELN